MDVDVDGTAMMINMMMTMTIHTPNRVLEKSLHHQFIMMAFRKSKSERVHKKSLHHWYYQVIVHEDGE